MFHKRGFSPGLNIVKELSASIWVVNAFICVKQVVRAEPMLETHRAIQSGIKEGHGWVSEKRFLVDMSAEWECFWVFQQWWMNCL